ncbi:MAG: hypothetical protein HY000_13815 [Planctomycetes bacterium]|nr:hypothetical protein [Planctomycetota bacterium]
MPADGLRSGILLLQAETDDATTAPTEDMLARFHAHGIALTAYEGGLIRMSMPRAPLAEGDIELISTTLRQCLRIGPAHVRIAASA